jgi:uncharacterized protein (DUF1501 family)
MPAMGELADAVRAYRAAQASVTSAQAAAARKVKAAREQAAIARQRVAAAMVAETLAGARQVDIVRITGYSRERVRQILRENGIEAPD